MIAVPIFIDDSGEIDACLERAGRAVGAGARLIEWRIDALVSESDAAEALVELVRRSPAPCIVTCRSAAEGGMFEGDDEVRAELLRALGEHDARARYIDLELASWRDSAVLRGLNESALRSTQTDGQPSTGLILSSHDMRGRPADLLQRIEAMTNDPDCSVIKIAWFARSLRDNLEAFDLLAERRRPMIALCMGEFGLMSRVLAPKFGGLLTFATDAPGGETAPGQPTIEELRSRYRYDSIGRETRIYGVIGWPVAHSKSPDLHNAGFAAVDHDGVYLPMPIPPEYEHFKATVGSMVDHNRLDFRGASVTIPHKANLLRFVEQGGGRIDALSERIGAANTLIVGSAGGLACANTDSPAAVDALGTTMRIDRKDLAELRIAVIGAGGVARAVIAGLAEQGATVVIFNRTEEKAAELAERFSGIAVEPGAESKVIVGESSRLGRGGFHIIINCTPVGMAGGPDPEGNPLEISDTDVPLDDSVTVFDTVYTPQRTPMIREAEARGARVVTGVDMFIRQAAMQFRMWTGRDLPERAARDALG